MDLETRVEGKIGENVKDFMHRNAKQGKTIRHCSMAMDVSPSTASRWAQRYEVKFSAKNPFLYGWRIEDV